MNELRRVVVAAIGLGFGLVPAFVWAASCADAPYFTAASSQQIPTNLTGYTTFVVSAREKALPGCPSLPSGALKMTAVGLPVPPGMSNPATDEVAATITVPNNTSALTGSYSVAYTVTDLVNNTSTSVSLPIKIGSVTNTSPTLDPVSDLVMSLGQTLTFSVGVSDPDGDLNYLDSNALTTDGLPLSLSTTKKSFTRLTANRIVCQVTLTPTLLTERGIYRITIAGKDARGGMVMAQMRLVIQ